METIKSLLKKLGGGLVIGIVAGATAGLIFSVASIAISQSVWRGDAEVIKQATITNDREVNRNGKTIILGTVKNNSEDSMRMFEIKADLYDENGTFVEQCTEYISNLHGGKQTNFKITCKSCDSNTTIEHASYKIYMGGF